MRHTSVFGREIRDLSRHSGLQFRIFRTLVSSLIDSWMERPETLKKRDHAREKSADWFRSNEMVGGVCYVD